MTRFDLRWDRLPILLLVGLAGLFGLRCVYDWDVWWHLLAGEWIIEHWAIPRVDPFGSAEQGAEWIDLHWLFQVALFVLHRGCGWWGPTLVQAAIAAATMGLCVMACGGFATGRRVVLPLLAALLLLQTRLQLRPELVTFFCVAALLVVIDRLDRRAPGVSELRGACVLAVVLQLVWVNCHSLFVLGPIIGSLFVAGTALSCMMRVSPPGSVARVPLAVWMLPVLQAAVSLANPYGWKGLLFPAVVFGRISGAAVEFSEVISEFHPTLTLLPYDPTAWLFLGLMGWGVVSFVRARGDVRWWRFLVFFAFAYLGFAARRNLPLFGLVAAVVIGQNARDRSAGLDSNRAAPRKPARGRTARGGADRPSDVPSRTIERAVAARWVGEFALVLFVAALVGTGVLYRWFRMDTRLGIGVMPARFPADMAEQVASQPSPVVFPVHLGYGNYFLWRGYPGVRSFIDGRLEVHDAVYGTYLEIVDDLTDAPARALARLRSLGVTHVAVHYGSNNEIAMMRGLRHQSGVVLRFVDGTGALFAIVPADGLDTACVGFELAAAVDLLEPGRRGWPDRWLDWLPTDRARVGDERLRGATLLLHVFDAPQSAIRYLLAAGSAKPAGPYVWGNLALAYERLAESAAAPAERSLRRAQAAHARSALHRLTDAATAMSSVPLGAEFGVAVPAGLRDAVAALVRGRYAESQRALQDCLRSESLDAAERYFAHWLLAVIALDSGDRALAVLHGSFLAESTAPAELGAVGAEAADWLERLRCADQPPADPANRAGERYRGRLELGRCYRVTVFRRGRSEPCRNRGSIRGSWN